MENQIVCPNCHKTLPTDPLIEAAARKDYTESGSLICECGERITFWNMTAQFREQKKLKYRFRAWWRSISRAQS